MIENYQEQAKLQKSVEPVKSQDFATVVTVYADGVTLMFDDSVVESVKHYKFNKSITFVAGDRVKIFKASGTYIVEYAI